MNANLRTWSVGKVTTLEKTFEGAARFAAVGLDAWITVRVTAAAVTAAHRSRMCVHPRASPAASPRAYTNVTSSLPCPTFVPQTSVTSLVKTFSQAQIMNVNVIGWDTSSVVDLSSIFYGASRFTGTGLQSWDTSSVTTMFQTFREASVMDGDISGWDTSSVVHMSSVFAFASALNVDLGKWDVSNVLSLGSAFSSTSVYLGEGLDKWDVGKVTDMALAFADASSVPSCAKYKISRAWKTNTAFAATSYITEWANETCPVRVCMPATSSTSSLHPSACIRCITRTPPQSVKH